MCSVSKCDKVHKMNIHNANTEKNIWYSYEKHGIYRINSLINY